MSTEEPGLTSPRGASDNGTAAADRVQGTPSTVEVFRAKSGWRCSGAARVSGPDRSPDGDGLIDCALFFERDFFRETERIMIRTWNTIEGRLVGDIIALATDGGTSIASWNCTTLRVPFNQMTDPAIELKDMSLIVKSNAARTI